MRTGFQEHQLKRHQIRLENVHGILSSSDLSSVLDLGCGDGQLIERLAEDPQFTKLTGLDINTRSLAEAESITRDLATRRNGELELSYFAGSLLTKAQDLPSHEAVTMVEVIEHFPAEILSDVEHVVFELLNPELVIVTTPAAEPGSREVKRPEHFFEWTAGEAAAWMNRTVENYGYLGFQEVINTDPLPGLDLQILSFVHPRTFKS